MTSTQSTNEQYSKVIRIPLNDHANNPFSQQLHYDTSDSTTPQFEQIDAELIVISDSLVPLPSVAIYSNEPDEQPVVQGTDTEAIYWVNDVYRLGGYTPVATQENDVNGGLNNLNNDDYTQREIIPEDIEQLRVRQVFMVCVQTYKQNCNMFACTCTLVSLFVGVVAFLSLADILFRPSLISGSSKLMYVCLTMLSIPNNESIEKVNLLTFWSPLYYVKAVLAGLLAHPAIFLMLELILLIVMSLSAPPPILKAWASDEEIISPPEASMAGKFDDYL